MIIPCLLLFFLSTTVVALPSLQKYIHKYKPTTTIEGTRIIRKYPNNRIEVTMSFGATEDMILAGEAAINDVYTGDLFAQGDETERMGQIMEHYFGKYWSPAYIAFDVNGKGIAFAKEGSIRIPS
ncbi:unnamed protein product [Heligmosomoides polygyrus]|uniref:Peptidase A1 domain-containing protein n=1 Tax=Heligmosomoides polygyrus TaxID=6339 RepID=A0A3P7X3J7_HELPZ|nr:unnamed protein product [Heligmosomoides polygyrus]